MRVNYHYYTIKTLAYYAGFDDKTAQFIAYFSQYIDEFIMRRPFIVDKEPPDFFFKSRLTIKLSKDKWIFLPCPTGINVFNSGSHGYQLYTIMPFHFIMPVAFNKLPESGDRSRYRCVGANQGDSLLINHLMQKAVAKANVQDLPSLMPLSMLLHTYADSYAHNGFSGFHGWENESFIAKLEHIHLGGEANFFSGKPQNLVKKIIFGKLTDDHTMGLAEKAYYCTLPSIGHANVDHAPDLCERKVILYVKESVNGKMKPFIERNSSESFADCSRSILNILCKVKGNPAPNDEEWKKLQEKLSQAQDIDKQGDNRANRKKWSQVFPEISFNYRKDEFINIKLKGLKYRNDRELMDMLEVSNKSLSDIYSEKGDRARASFPMVARDISDLFFTFNELAYKHVYSTTGEFASLGSFEQLLTYKELASNMR